MLLGSEKLSLFKIGVVKNYLYVVGIQIAGVVKNYLYLLLHAPRGCT